MSLLNCESFPLLSLVHHELDTITREPLPCLTPECYIVALTSAHAVRSLERVCNTYPMVEWKS